MNHWLLRVWALVVLAAAFGAGSLRAQDTTAMTDTSWNYNFGPMNVNGPVHKVAVAPNGDIYVGGEFTTINGVNVNRIARWNGTTWSALGTGIPGGSVHAIAFNGNDVYVGGNFVTAGSVPANNIARWNGSQWSFLGKRDNEQGVDPTVTHILFVGNTMYVAGSFIYGGNNDLLNRIARWNSAERIFVPLEGTATRGLDDSVFAVVAQGNKIYVGGKFPNAGGATAARVAVWDIDAQTWSKLGNGLGNQGSSDAYATALAIRDSILYVGGDFGFAGGTSARKLAQYNVSTGKWSGIFAAKGGNGVDGIPTALALDDRGNLYVAGAFTVAGNSDTAKGIVKYVIGPRKWIPLGSGVTGTVNSMATTGRYLYVGGSFTKAGDKNSPYLARWYDSAFSTTPVDTSDTSTTSVELVNEATATLTAAPNPAKGSATISFSLSNAAHCTIDIRNVHGEVVATLVSERLEAGPYNVRWNAAGVPDGVYFCRLHSGNVTQTTKLVLMR